MKECSLVHARIQPFRVDSLLRVRLSSYLGVMLRSGFSKSYSKASSLVPRLGRNYGPVAWAVNLGDILAFKESVGVRV